MSKSHRPTAITQQFGPLKEPPITGWIGHSGIAYPVYGDNPHRNQCEAEEERRGA